MQNRLKYNVFLSFCIEIKIVLLEFRKRLLSILQEILTLPTVPISLVFLVERLLHIIIDDNKRIQIVAIFFIVDRNTDFGQ